MVVCGGAARFSLQIRGWDKNSTDFYRCSNTEELSQHRADPFVSFVSGSGFPDNADADDDADSFRSARTYSPQQLYITVNEHPLNHQRQQLCPRATAKKKNNDKHNNKQTAQNKQKAV